MGILEEDVYSVIMLTSILILIHTVFLCFVCRIETQIKHAVVLCEGAS